MDLVEADEVEQAEVDSVTQSMGELALQQQPGTPQQQELETAQQQQFYYWTGEVEWRDNWTPGPKEIYRTLRCIVSSRFEEVKNWPKKLEMQLMPTIFVRDVGFLLLHDSKKFIIQPIPGEGRTTLIRFMDPKCWGIVRGLPEHQFFILTYSREKDVFLGLIPSNQLEYFQLILAAARNDDTDF